MNSPLVELNPSFNNGKLLRGRGLITDHTSTCKDDIEYFSRCNVVLMKNVIQNPKVVQSIAKELESLKFDYSVNDLHSLAQTADFSDLGLLPPHLSEFVLLLQTQLRRVVEDLFDTKTKNKMTITGSIYNKGDYLLCHDDLCGDRHIAFVYYLSEHWTEDDGGALRFFSHDGASEEPVHNHYNDVLIPTFNSLVVFRVSNTSHHEVQEVFTSKQRLSINGWFHCDDVDTAGDTSCPSLFQKAQLMQFTEYNSCKDPSEILQMKYISSLTRRDMSKSFINGTLLLAEDFLNEEFYKKCAIELTDESLNWKIKGPPNHRKYEVLDSFITCNRIDISNNLPHVKSLLNFFISEFWLAYLNQLTNLEFAVFDEKHCPPVCMVEVQRWKEGSYSLLSDNDYMRVVPTIEVTVFFQVDDSSVGSEGTDVNGRCNMSGNVIQTIKPTIPKNILEMLSRIKVQRIQANLINEEVERQNRLLQRHKKYPKVNKATLARIQSHVRAKVDKIKQYRLNAAETQNQVVTPKSNSILITMNSNSSFKFTSYIQKTWSGLEPKTCYHSVTLTYVTTCSYDERTTEQYPE